jgi:hypothetical protein
MIEIIKQYKINSVNFVFFKRDNVNLYLSSYSEITNNDMLNFLN